LNERRRSLLIRLLEFSVTNGLRATPNLLSGISRVQSLEESLQIQCQIFTEAWVLAPQLERHFVHGD
jgi:hypothetical protein